MAEQTFEQFWQTVEEYAKELGLPVQYVEEEFVIDGELIKVTPTNNESWEDLAVELDTQNRD